MINKNNKKFIEENFYLFRRLAFLLVFSFLFFVQLSSFISAIGIVPAGRLFDYEPGSSHTIDVTVLNSNNRNMEVSLYAQGDFSDSLFIDDRILKFDSSVDKITTKVTFTVPFDLEPGLQVINLVALELPGKSSTSAGNFISATSSVVSQFKVNVPYPGLYAKADMLARSSDNNEPVNFVISIFNAGSDDIVKAFADVNIFGPTNEKIDSIKSDSISIISKKEGKLFVSWDGVKNPGKYFARASVNYDGKKLLVEKVFEVGEKSVSVSDMRVESYQLGSIAKVFLDIDNNWNQDISEVFAVVDVLDKSGTVVSSFKTVTASLDAFSSSTIEGFWDTANLLSDEYDLVVSINFDGKVSKHVAPVFLALDEVKFLSNKGTGMVVSGGSSFGSANGREKSKISLLSALVVLLVVFNIGFFVYLRRHPFSSKSGGSSSGSSDSSFVVDSSNSNYSNKLVTPSTSIDSSSVKSSFSSNSQSVNSRNYDGADGFDWSRND